MKLFNAISLTIAISLVASHQQALAVNVLTPGDPIIAIDIDPPASNSSYPGGESPANAIDGTLDKYLNFAGAGSGFIVTPSESTTVQSFQLTTANDAQGRDPTSYEIWGTNSPIATPDNGTGLDEPWTLISSGDLELPGDRDTLAPAVGFSNTDPYSSYKLLFPTVGGLPQMQIAEASFFPDMAGAGVDFLDAGDDIRAVHIGPTSSSPPGQGPDAAIDSDVGSVYLNFGEENSGFIVTPSVGATNVNAFKITTGADAVERDPASWRLFGTNDPITTPQNGRAEGETWTLIADGTLALPDERTAEGDEISFTNNAGSFTSYRMDFPTVKNEGLANSMQFGEIELLATEFAKLQVNRASGEVILTASEDITIESYEVQSPDAGGLDDSNWTSIASTGADPDDTWTETSAPGDGSSLAEEDVPSNGANNGFSLTSGNSYSLGNVWRALPVIGEDVAIDLRDENGERLLVSVEYIGSEVLPGDYNNDGTVDIGDWPTFLAGYGGDYTGMTLAQAYFGGDLDQDFDSDLNDFNLFVELAGGSAALFGVVPEPTSLALMLGAMIAYCGLSRSGRARKIAVAVATIAAVGATGSDSSAQSFTNVGGAPISVSIPAGQMNETPDSGPINFFDDDFLDDPGIINDELFLLDYNDPDLQGGPFAQYAGLGADPKTVFFDYGSSVTANWFAYSQRSGADPTADRVGMFEFWFSNTDFAGTLPATEPDSVVKLLPTDARLQDSALRPYSLSGDQSGRYVAMRLTVSELSINQGTNNIGGHEFRLLDGPSDVVLEVDRATGGLTLKNNLPGSVGIEMKSYSIQSPAGGLDDSNFNGIGGDSGAFPLGDGSGNGWEVGGGSSANRLVEAFFSGDSTLASGTGGLDLGDGYNPLSLSEDLVFTWTNSDGDVYDARVEYVGTAPINLLGDYNDDGVVDAVDYATWREALGTATVLPNDSTPGTVDQNDFSVWKANFGDTSDPGSSTSIPEPTALALLIATIWSLTAVRLR